MLVVDASVMVKLAAAEPDSAIAIDAIVPRDDCIAPDLLLIELASALAKKMRSAGLPFRLARQGFDSVLPMLAEIADTEPLLEPAMRLSAQMNHSLFDSLYLSLAIERDCAVLTADMQFATRAVAAGYGPHIRTLHPLPGA